MYRDPYKFGLKMFVVIYSFRQCKKNVWGLIPERGARDSCQLPDYICTAVLAVPGWVHVQDVIYYRRRAFPV